MPSSIHVNLDSKGGKKDNIYTQVNVVCCSLINNRYALNSALYSSEDTFFQSITAMNYKMDIKRNQGAHCKPEAHILG